MSGSRSPPVSPIGGWRRGARVRRPTKPGQKRTATRCKRFRSILDPVRRASEASFEDAYTQINDRVQHLSMIHAETAEAS
jgi:hypothetical protein